ncbi:MAG: hypothetical protein ACRC5T_11215 [Cetobacterium sp.]
MAFNGSGTFLRVMNWVNDATSGIKIRADRHDQEDDNIANGLSQCITKDGQTTITANLPMAGYKHTGVGNAAARTEYATLGQVQDGAGSYYTSSGSSNAYVVTTSPAITSYVAGQIFYIKANFTNTGAATINISSLGAKDLTKQGGIALASGDLVVGTIYTIQYDGTKFQVSPVANPSFATVSAPRYNITGAASNTYLSAAGTGFNVFCNGVNNAYFYDSGISLGGSLNSTGAISTTNNIFGATITSTASFVNASTSPGALFNETDAPTDEKFTRFSFTAGNFLIDFVNDAFSASSTLLEVDRVGTVPSYFRVAPRIEALGGLIGLSTANLTYTNGVVGNVAHGLGRKPFMLTMTLICQATDGEFVANDEVVYYPMFSDSSSPTIKFGVVAYYNDNTNIRYRVSDDGIFFGKKSTPDAFVLDPTKWKFKFNYL